MTKYRAKTADVLNEADAFERRLNWTLFTMEQDQLLWGENPKVDWVPGDYIHPDPRLNPFYHMAWALNRGVDGNFVRPMIEEYVDGEKHKTMRCQDCQVDWLYGDICWVCGKEWPPKFKPTVSDLDYIAELLGFVSDRGPRGIMTSREAIDRYILHDLERTRDLMMQMREPVRRAAENVEEMTRAINEFANTPFNWQEHIQFDVPIRIDFPRQMGRRVFLDETPENWDNPPSAPEPVTILGHEMPENWDDPTPPVPLPEMPPPRDFSTWTLGYSYPNNSRLRFYDS